MKTTPCTGCRFAIPVYMGDGDDLLTACVYLLRAGHKRPCPPGEACTVREPAETGFTQKETALHMYG